MSRVVSPTDRRTQIVRLTTQGKRVLLSMTPAHEEWIESMFAETSAEERAQLFALLGRLRESIRSALVSEVEE